MISKLVTVFLALFSVAALADSAPDCIDRGTALQINNEQVIRWKSSTRNSFQARARVSGPVTQVYPDHSGHHHFQITLDNVGSNTLEVIFNEDFGTVPAIHTGMQIEACGDYITSIAQSGPYPASPDGAIIHWVHISPRLNRHQSGYIAINGVPYGMEFPNN